MIMETTITAQIARLEYIITSNESVKNYVNEISDLLETLTNEERLLYSNKIKSRVQNEALIAFTQSKDWGSIYMATGTGKSKIVIDYLYNFGHRDKKYLLCVPTEKLRDENWKEEFAKWDCSFIYNNIERCCYASLNKYEGQVFDQVILDEGHNITENNSKFFLQNEVKSCILLTATKPKDATKLQILRELGLNSVYEISLDESVKLGLVAPYDITIVTMTLEAGEKYIKAGSKVKPFMQNERERYNYLSRVVMTSPTKFSFINRMRFIYDLRSKTEAARWILANVIPEDQKTLTFCGGIEQAIALCNRRFFSKPSLSKKDKLKPEKVERVARILAQYEGDAGFEDFKAGRILRLACVESLNEGHNLPDLDVGFIVQLNASDLDLIQRIGRLIRYRIGHRAKIIILCVEDTVDKNWIKKATASLSGINIRTIELSRLKMGIEKIDFD